MTLYLDSKTLSAARKHAFKQSTSLSDIVSRLLVAEIDSKSGIASRHPRRLGEMSMN